MAENSVPAPAPPPPGPAPLPPPPDSTMTFISLVLAIFIPPLGVFLRYGCEIEFWICLLLLFLGYVPGIIYAIWVIVK